jgi:predicted nucleotidyltransferase
LQRRGIAYYDSRQAQAKAADGGMTQEGPRMRTLDNLALADKDRRAVEAASRMLRQGFPVDRVVLFGSKARGTDDADSDIDLLVLTTRPVDWHERDRITDALFDLQLNLDVVISALVVDADSWENGPQQVLPIRAEVEREGVAV